MPVLGEAQLYVAIVHLFWRQAVSTEVTTC